MSRMGQAETLADQDLGSLKAPDCTRHESFSAYLRPRVPRVFQLYLVERILYCEM